MSILDNLLARIGYTKATESAPAHLLHYAENMSFNMPGYQLPKAQAELYQRLSWIAIAVGHVANMAATTPLSVKQRSGESTDDIENHPFEELLMRPNPHQSRFEFLEEMFLWRQLTGNAYWWINAPNENAAPVEMWNIPAWRIEPVPDGRMYLKGYLYDPGDGVKIPLEPWEIVHFKRFNPNNSFIGLSPIEALAEIAVADMAAQKWNANFYSKDHAKPAGALAFADPISDNVWKQMQDEIKRQHGGTKRNLMMLRNTGAGGVAWVNMTIAQKDMQFLEGREFTRDEIYSIYAPGLASWLAINSTEANSKSGRDAFHELAVFPIHQQAAETISNKLLPRYGDNLQCEFDDVRSKDRVLELQEQEAFSQVHTVAEIRERFYGDKPLGDDRDNKLPKEIGGFSFGGGSDDSTDQPSQDSAEPEEPEEVKAELDKWLKFALNRSGKPARPFKTDIVPPVLKASIEASLEGLTDVDEIRAVFADAGRWSGYP